MLNLKESLAGLPTRPVLYLASAVIAIGLGYHFITTYQSCRGHAELRERLEAAVAASADGTSPGPVRLSRIIDVEWDRAEILVDYKPAGSTADCPFGWDWSQKTREALIAADRLIVIVFLRGGRLVNYLELRSDRVSFVGISNPYTPETALFTVSPGAGHAGVFTLSPVP